MATILDEALAACSQRCAEAIESNVEASKAIALHTAILRTAMDDSSGNDVDPLSKPQHTNENVWICYYILS